MDYQTALAFFAISILSFVLASDRSPKPRN
jgi:hypothetical protein